MRWLSVSSSTVESRSLQKRVQGNRPRGKRGDAAVGRQDHSQIQAKSSHYIKNQFSHKNPIADSERYESTNGDEIKLTVGKSETMLLAASATASSFDKEDGHQESGDTLNLQLDSAPSSPKKVLLSPQKDISDLLPYDIVASRSDPTSNRRKKKAFFSRHDVDHIIRLVL